MRLIPWWPLQFPWNSKNVQLKRVCEVWAAWIYQLYVDLQYALERMGAHSTFRKWSRKYGETPTCISLTLLTTMTQHKWKWTHCNDVTICGHQINGLQMWVPTHVRCTRALIVTINYLGRRMLDAQLKCLILIGALFSWARVVYDR